MNQRGIRFFLVLGVLIAFEGTPMGAFASEGYLDPPYHPGTPPVLVVNDLGLNATLPSQSDTLSLISKMTPVKDQADRGTCSIFSSTAILEAMLNIRFNTGNNFNLSEEWLEFIEMHTGRGEGSETDLNFPAFRNYGSASAEVMPYIGDTWTSASSGVAAERCGSLSGDARKICLLAHYNPALLSASDTDLNNPQDTLYDPAFATARTDAFSLRDKYLTGLQGPYHVTSLKEVKTLLSQGIPLVLDLTFFSGAWNHQQVSTWGLPRSISSWHKGLVGYPEKGSVDREKSEKDPDGHSIVLVGYDDNYVMETHQVMTDGSTRKFTYTGAFFFKNSWGTDDFGTETSIDGQTEPGYGIITEQYATEFGEFYQLPL
jgi:hypothetical protein